MTTKLDFMVNVETNLTELGRQFQVEGGRIKRHPS